jgi:hypothetical protein
MHSLPSRAEWTTSSRSSDQIPTRLAATLHAAMEVCVATNALEQLVTLTFEGDRWP